MIIEGGQGRPVVRRPMLGRAAAVLAGVALLAACSQAVEGSAAKPSPTYQPLSAETMTATALPLPENSMAISRDGTSALVRGDDDRYCVRPVDQAAGSSGSCLDLPDDARPGRATFSPDGTLLALNEDFAVTFRGRLWIASVADGSVTEVAPVDRSGSGSPSSGPTDASTAASTAAPSTSAGSSAEESTGAGLDLEGKSAYYSSSFDPDTGRLVVMEFGVARDDRRDLLAVVDPSTAVATPLAYLDDEQRYGGTMAVGGGVVVLSTSQGRDFRLQQIRETGGTLTELPERSTADLLADGSVPLPLAVSSDGTRLLANGFNQQTFRSSGPLIIDLVGTGAPTKPTDLVPDTPAWTGTFSPDGSQILVLAAAGDGQDLRLWDGSAARTLGTSEGKQDVVNLTLAWSPGNVVVPSPARGYLREDAVAWTLSG